MQDGLRGFYASLVEFQKRNVWAILFIMLIVTGTMLFYAMRLEVDSTLDQQLKPEDDYLSLKKVIQNEFDESDAFFVVVTVDKSNPDKDTVNDLRDPEVLHALDSLEKTLENEPEVKNATSIAAVFKSVFGRLPESLEESKEWQRMLGKDADAFFNNDASATIMNVSVNIPKKAGARDDVEARMEKKVSDAPFPLGINAAVTGFPKLLNEIINLMIRDSVETMAIALLFVFAILLFLFRKLSLTLITIAPVIVAVIWLAGTMTLLGIKLSVANATVAAMVIGLGVDYAIHFVNSFDAKIKKNSSKPITETAKVVGSALSISFLTTLVGFSVNLLGSTEAIRVQGLTLALGVIFAFTTTMILIPVLLKLKIEILREEHGDQRWK